MGLWIITGYAERLCILISPLCTISSAIQDSCGTYHSDSQEGQRQSARLIVLSSITGNDNKVFRHSSMCVVKPSTLRLLQKLLLFRFELSIQEMNSPWKHLGYPQHGHSSVHNPNGIYIFDSTTQHDNI